MKHIQLFNKFINEGFWDEMSMTSYSRMTFDDKMDFIKSELNKLKSKHKLFINLKRDCLKFVADLTKYANDFRNIRKKKPYTSMDYYDPNGFKKAKIREKYLPKYKNYKDNFSKYANLTSLDKQSINRALHLLYDKLDNTLIYLDNDGVTLY